MQIVNGVEVTTDVRFSVRYYLKANKAMSDNVY